VAARETGSAWVATANAKASAILFKEASRERPDERNGASGSFKCA
jgi:hypothetical protein